MNLNVKLHEIHRLITEEKYELAEEKLTDGYDELIKKSRSYYSLLIKTKIKLNKLDEVYKLLNGNNLMKKIDYLNYIESSTNYEKIYTIFNLCIKNYRLNTTEIDFIINKKLYFLLRKLDGYHVSTSLNGNLNDLSELKTYKFSINSYNTLTKIFTDSIKNKKYIEKLNKKIKSVNFKVIIDFGNIIYRFSNTEKFKEIYLKYDYLLKFFNNIKEQYGEPLIISSKKHFKSMKDEKTNDMIKKIKEKYKENIFFSAFGEDDDNFIILASLLTNNKIITRDKFKNHLNKFREVDKFYDIFKIYINQKTFDHYIIAKKRKPKLVKNKCIQVFDNFILVPSENKNFLKIELYKEKENRTNYIFYIILLFTFVLIYLLYFNYKYIITYFPYQTVQDFLQKQVFFLLRFFYDLVL